MRNHCAADLFWEGGREGGSRRKESTDLIVSILTKWFVTHNLPLFNIRISGTNTEN